MYARIEDFIADWKIETEATLKIFSKISDDKLFVKVKDNIRTLGKVAWHITQTLTEMPCKAGIVDEDYLENKPVPAAMSEIMEAYKYHSNELLRQIETNWTDESLHEQVNMYGEMWEKGKILAVLITHQIHHRAQMTIIMRLLDIVVPGIYGPAKEEWAQFGMEAME